MPQAICPCWDPWKIGCKRLTRNLTGKLTQSPTSHSVIGSMKDRSKFQISQNLLSPSRIQFIPGTHKLPLQSRESQDIAKDFTQLSPSFYLAHKRGQFLYEKSSDTSFSKPILPRSKDTMWEWIQHQRVECRRKAKELCGLAFKTTLDYSGPTHQQPLQLRASHTTATGQRGEQFEEFSTSPLAANLQSSLEKLFPNQHLSLSLSLSQLFLQSTPPKQQTDDIVADLVEQISELTGIVEQLHRDHENSQKELEDDMEKKYHDLQEKHENEVRQTEARHKSEVDTLEEQHKKELRTERATAQEKLAGMLKEYKYLKNAFRVYQDSISDEMEEKWLRRQAEWKKSERTEREKALLQQKQSLMKKFELELEEQRKLSQTHSFLSDKTFQKEKEEFLKQHEEDLEKIRILTEKINTLEEEVKEKNETLNAIASALHNTEIELQNEKAALADAEKSVQHRITALEDKHRANMNNMVEENVALRRKLLEKNEELLNERSQRSFMF
ncbi:flagellum-associated coiled-coil domain-containing protein 1 [Sphaerodactylus townsendi]|uniref:flagellum-associated coiled-coil domain-containing protein 1 n=1 Tax=Sphaerodactylus townsendi TaxID=933632 RepID=UPI0020276805|nr:flagellum-associated coiled-coil domain-containing protein 1 [Sphaerodactylus townsendi]